jgi:antidote-toxin recognition MazE-like antitoxin
MSPGAASGPVAARLVGDWFRESRRDRLHVTMAGTRVPTSTRVKSSREKVRAHRERLRSRGLRPIQIWVPDVRSRSFKIQAHRQSLAVARSPHAPEDQGFIDSITDSDGD